MKPTILIQLDTDPQPSVFDSVVAIDSGAEHLLRHGAITPDNVTGLVHGALFTRGPAELARTAIFVGGSDVQAAEAVWGAVRSTFFGPFRVSGLLDANGCNTTAAAAVLAAIEGARKSRGSLDGATVAVLAATGPVGQRVARLLLGLGAGLAVRVGSRSAGRARATAEAIKARTGHEAQAFATSDASATRAGVEGADVVIAAGAAGVTLLPRAIWEGSTIKSLIDLNAVPPLGIEGVESADRGTDRAGILCWGALGVGGMKMKIHRRAIQQLFEANDQVLDAEECLAIGRCLVGD
jgi:hypothetical protein